jgi:MFS superfamily sulfate permease-like transporter
MLEIGAEQLAVYVTTIVAVLATDLLVGIAVGMALELFIHVVQGVPLRSLFKPKLELQEVEQGKWRIEARHAAVFSNWIPLRRQIEKIRRDGKHLEIDLSGTRLVDHTVMCKLHEIQREFERESLMFEVTGLDSHKPRSKHRLAARRNKAARVSLTGA